MCLSSPHTRLKSCACYFTLAPVPLGTDRRPKLHPSPRGPTVFCHREAAAPRGTASDTPALQGAPDTGGGDFGHHQASGTAHTSVPAPRTGARKPSLGLFHPLCTLERLPLEKGMGRLLLSTPTQSQADSITDQVSLWLPRSHRAERVAWAGGRGACWTLITAHKAKQIPMGLPSSPSQSVCGVPGSPLQPAPHTARGPSLLCTAGLTSGLSLAIPNPGRGWVTACPAAQTRLLLRPHHSKRTRQ